MTLSELDREGLEMTEEETTEQLNSYVGGIDDHYQESGSGMVVEDGKPTWFIDDWEVEG